MPTFEEILKGIQDKHTNLLNQNTLKWYLDQIKQTAKDSLNDTEIKKGQISSGDTAATTEEHLAGEKSAQTERDKLRTNIANTAVIETTNAFDVSKIGKVLFYTYDPKTKEKLKYWDMYPLVIPFSYHFNGWTGMNMHYLPPLYRAQLFTALMTLANNTELDPLTKLNVTYQILKNSSRFAYFKPCIKRYLISHLRSRIMIINPMQWTKVMMMPLAGFQKQSETTVWQDSVDMIRNAQGQWKNG
jgi:hypothetical protein